MTTHHNDNRPFAQRAWLSGRWMVTILLCGAVAIAASLTTRPGIGATPARAAFSGAQGDQAEVLSPLAMRVINPPNPVLGADNKQHLAYEIQIINTTPVFVTIGEVQTLNPNRNNAVVSTLRGAHLAAMLRLVYVPNPSDTTVPPKAAPSTTIRPAHHAYLFMDVTVARGARIPSRLTHRFVLQMRPTAASTAAQSLSFVGVSTPVGPRAIVIAPPLTGSNWWMEGGCCDPYSYHRSATLSINGTVHVPERYAIDFEQLNAEGRVFNGDISRLSNYTYFGVPIHAVAPGTVVGELDGQPEQVPGKLPSEQPNSGITAANAGGNYIVEKIGKGRFAFYAHMQPGSLRVKIGDRLGTGQVIGLLGNTGNSSAPHLHFHIMSGPSPLESNGLPFEITSFHGQGMVTNMTAVDEGHRANIIRSQYAGPHRNQMPLGLQIVSFP